MIKAILFDLDGTLLPLDNDEFIKEYFKGLVKKLAPHGADADRLTGAVWNGTKEMIKSDGARRNDESFWLGFAKAYGAPPTDEENALFDEFYEKDFDSIQRISSYNEHAREIIKIIREKGLKIALATNPVFPPIATRKRMGWTGLVPEDFDLYTHYENSRFCKPSKGYYLDVAGALGVKPEECLMVGNDAYEDMVALELGMSVYLVTDYLINKENRDISAYPHGSFTDLIEYVKSL